MPEEARLIAACGMNCGVCVAHLRKDRQCPGCRVDDIKKPFTRRKCVIKNCETVKSSRSGFCCECQMLPCKRLKQLDKRYRTKYSMSMLDNLEFISENGLAAFVEKEKERWRCRKCGGVICVHLGYCYQCGAKPD